MIQLTTFTDFSISPWTNSASAHEQVFKLDKLRYNVVPLIDFLHETLYALGKPFVYRSLFTLTNVTSGISMLSYGLNRAPLKRLRKANGLHLTFAFTARKWYNEKNPRYVLPVASNVTFWGYSLSTSSDFMTISVPHSVVKAMGFRTFNLREMYWLYHLVGAITKNFVFRNNFYVENDNYNNTPITSSLTYTQLPLLFKLHPYDTWIYSYYAWRTIPNTLNPKSVDEQFCEHYIYNLKQFFGKYKTANVLEIESKLRYYVGKWLDSGDPRVPAKSENVTTAEYVNTLLGARK